MNFAIPGGAVVVDTEVGVWILMDHLQVAVHVVTPEGKPVNNIHQDI